MDQYTTNRSFAYPPHPGYGAPWIPPYLYPPANNQYEYASFMRRLVAGWVDGFILMIPAGFAFIGVVWYLGYDPERWESSLVLSLLNLALFVMVLAYHIGFTAKGGTPGFRALGLSVTAQDGTNPGLRRAIYRQAFLWASIALGIVSSAVQQIFTRDGELETLVTISAIATGLSMLLSAVQFIGCLMVIWDGHKQALHDKIAGTYVIHQRC